MRNEYSRRFNYVCPVLYSGVITSTLFFVLIANSVVSEYFALILLFRVIGSSVEDVASKDERSVAIQIPYINTKLSNMQLHTLLLVCAHLYKHLMKVNKVRNSDEIFQLPASSKHSTIIVMCCSTRTY